MLVEVPLTCGRCAYREEIAVFKDTIHRCGRDPRARDVDPMSQVPPAWCKSRPKAEPAAPDLAPVIAHLRAEAERKRSKEALERFSAANQTRPGVRSEKRRAAFLEAASTFAREASALERAAEILARHV